MDSKVNKKWNPCIVPTSLIKACARGLQSGLDKGYKPQSYLDGDIEVYKNALYRHLISYLEGNTVDKESGLNTLDHISANIAILIELEKRIPSRKVEKGENSILPELSKNSNLPKPSEDYSKDNFFVDIIESFIYNGKEYNGSILACRSYYFGGYKVFVDGDWVTIDHEKIRR